MKKVLSVLVAVAMLASMSVLATTSASAETTWTLPLDVTDTNWKAETWDPSYAWSGLLAEVSDTIIGETTTEGLALSFPEGGKTDMTYPNARYENAGGLIQVAEDDYINIKLSCGESGQTTVTFAVLLNFLSNQINLTEAMVAAGAKSVDDNGKQVVGGDYEFSIKVSEAAKAYYDSHTDAKGSYDAIWGAGGNTYLTGVVFYLYSNTRDSSIPLVVKSVTIGSEGEFGTASTASSASTTTSTAAGTASSTSSSKTTSTGSSVETGESVLPIVGVAALAVVAGSAVVVSRKRK